MKKFLSIFVALAMAFSLFAGVGAGLAKADSTFTVTSSGNFFGGIDAVGAAATDGYGTVTASVYNSLSATVNVTTAAVGIFDSNVALNGPNITLYKVDTTALEAGLSAATPTLTSTDSNWRNAGNQVIAFGGTMKVTPGLAPGDVVTVVGGVNGVGTVKSSLGGGVYYVNVTTTIVNAQADSAGNRTGAISQVMHTTYPVSSFDEGWRTTGTKTITFNGPLTLAANDQLDVYMDQLQPAAAAYAYLTLSGTVSVGNVAAATWQDTTGVSHSASVTASTGDTLTSVTTNLTNAINAVSGGLVTATSGGASVIKLTQIVAGTVGNGKTLTASATANTVIIHTLGGLTQPAYVEVGRTLQLVATDQTGAIVTATWTNGTITPTYNPDGSILSYTSNTNANVTLTSAGLVLGVTEGAALITATLSNGQTGQFVVVVVAPQTLTSLSVNLVPATLKVAGRAQFGAIAASAGYAALDYTTQAAWSDTLPVAVVSNVAPTQGLLTYSVAETGAVTASVGTLTATTTATIDATGVLTATSGVITPVPTTTVIVLTIGTNIVSVNGKATSVDAAPEIVNSRTFVPIRFIAETFGSTVSWLPETKGITITLGTMTIGLQIANATAVINGNIIALEAAPYIKNSRTMVPLRVISESFGGNVVWNATNSTITITYVLPVVPAA
jgi:hypothetical protein